MSTSPSIAITGLGAVCGAGLKISQIWDAIVNGRSAIAPISQWDASRWPARMAAEVTGVDNRTLVEDRRLHKSVSRTDLLGLYAAESAIKDSGIAAHRATLDEAATVQFNDRTGVFSGAGGGNYKSNYDFFPLLTTAGGSMQTYGRELAGTVNPMWLLRNLPNNVLCHVGIRNGFKGTNGCVINQCVSGIMAVAEAAASIRVAEADRCVAVGHDTPLEPETVLHYHDFGLLAADTVRPFDAARSGTLFGEGAASVMLELESQARARNATIHGEYLGSGCVSEATGLLDIRPDGDGVFRSIQIALEDAGITPAQVGMIVAHGNGTRASDASEAAGIRRVFGNDLPPVTAFKWAFGHLIAASGVLDVTLALQALKARLVPGIPTLQSLDPELAPFSVSSAPQVPRSDIALVICRGFGGMNVAMIVRAASNAG